MVKNEWCLILWGFDRGWYKVKGSTNSNFNEHVEHFEAERIQHPEGHLKSIHVCWLDDIANWDSPEQIAQNLANTTDDIAVTDVDPMELSPHDRREFRKFKRYLTLRAKYGDAILMKRPFWRKYLGLE